MIQTKHCWHILKAQKKEKCHSNFPKHFLFKGWSTLTQEANGLRGRPAAPCSHWGGNKGAKTHFHIHTRVSQPTLAAVNNDLHALKPSIHPSERRKRLSNSCESCEQLRTIQDPAKAKLRLAHIFHILCLMYWRQLMINSFCSFNIKLAAGAF